MADCWWFCPRENRLQFKVDPPQTSPWLAVWEIQLLDNPYIYTYVYIENDSMYVRAVCASIYIIYIYIHIHVSISSKHIKMIQDVSERSWCLHFAVPSNVQWQIRTSCDRGAAQETAALSARSRKACRCTGCTITSTEKCLEPYTGRWCWLISVVRVRQDC